MELTPRQEIIMDKARKAYEGYCNYTNWKSLASGYNLPSWNELPGKIRNAWFAAISAIGD